MRKTLMAMAAFAMTMGSAVAGDHTANIVVVTHGSDTDAFWGVVRNAVDAAAKGHRCQCPVSQSVNW